MMDRMTCFYAEVLDNNHHENHKNIEINGIDFRVYDSLGYGCDSGLICVFLDYYSDDIECEYKVLTIYIYFYPENKVYCEMLLHGNIESKWTELYGIYKKKELYVTENEFNNTQEVDLIKFIVKDYLNNTDYYLTNVWWIKDFLIN